MKNRKKDYFINIIEINLFQLLLRSWASINTLSLYLCLMKYSKYFGLITKEKGNLNLSTSQFQRLMNIVFVEGVIYGLNKAKQTYKGTDLFYRYDTILFKENMKLTDLTGELKPDNLLREMHQLD